MPDEKCLVLILMFINRAFCRNKIVLECWPGRRSVSSYTWVRLFSLLSSGPNFTSSPSSRYLLAYVSTSVNDRLFISDNIQLLHPTDSRLTRTTEISDFTRAPKAWRRLANISRESSRSILIPGSGLTQVSSVSRLRTTWDQPTDFGLPSRLVKQPACCTTTCRGDDSGGGGSAWSWLYENACAS